MFKTQSIQNKVDENNRCQDRAWLSDEDQKRFALHPSAGAAPLTPELGQSDLGEQKTPPIYYIGQHVFYSGNHFIGMITKLYFTNTGQVSHLAIRTGRLLGSHKIVPVLSVSEVNGNGVSLTTSKNQFKDLPGYKSDANLAEDADRALWDNNILRVMDFQEIDVQVRNGIISLSGHVINTMSQWRAENAVEDIQGTLGVRNHLIPDDRLVFEVAEALVPIEQEDGNKLFTKVENGVVVLVGEMSSEAMRDRAEQCAADVSWVRGVINEIKVPGVVLDEVDQRFLQPSIGKELFFHDGPSVTVRQVVINPHNRRVVGIVALGQFPEDQQDLKYLPGIETTTPERLVVIPVSSILHLTRGTGLLSTSSTEKDQYKDFDPSLFRAPHPDWLPPYPYCPSEVLFPL